MKRAVILIMFFGTLLYSAGLKSGLYITEEPQFDSLMINYNRYCDLKIFKDGKTVFLSMKIWRDTGNWKSGSTGLYLAELKEQGDGTYYGRNDLAEFYIKKSDLDNEKIEINIVSMNMYSRINDAFIITSDREVSVMEKDKKMILEYSRAISTDEEKEAKSRAESFKKLIQSKK
jgi:hypothetical protein